MVEKAKMIIMQLAERIYVKENAAMADLCRKQTVVYNQAMFLIRQQFFTFGGQLNDPTNIIDLETGTIMPMPKIKRGKGQKLAAVEDELFPAFLSYYDLNDKNMLRWKQCYRDAIPGCAANTINRACDAWKGYWAALKAWKANPAKFTGKPKFPGFVEGDCMHVKTCMKMSCERQCPDFINSGKSPVYFTYAEFTIIDHHVNFPKAAGFEPVHVPRLADQKRGDSSAPVKQVRVIPSKNGGYWVECVHVVDDPPEKPENNGRIMAIDLNLNRVVMMVTSDSVGSKPLGISGGPIKSVNQLYNKMISKLQEDRARHDPRVAVLQQKQDRCKKAGAELEKLVKTDPANPRTDVLRAEMQANEISDAERQEWKRRTCYTKQMKAITKNRNNKVDAFFHRVSRFVIDEAMKLSISVIVIGHNKLQKQEINLGTRTNQNFVQMPVFKLIDKINYKADLAGITMVDISEEYTTQASFKDNDPIPTLDEFKANPIQFSGHRISRKKRNEYIDPKTNKKVVEYWKSRMYETANGSIMHGDVNDAYNILRKAFPDAVKSNGIAAARLQPEIRVIPAS
jgi:putative transposase